MSDLVSDLVRVSKLLSQRGICSRRKADEFLQKGWVLVNGEVAELGAKVSEDSQIELTAEAKNELQGHVTILLNKPIGLVSQLPEKGYEEARKLLVPENQFKKPGDEALDPRPLQQLAVCGRLDIDSKGLLVFSQSGQVAKSLIGASTKIEKEYLVAVEGLLDDKGLRKLNHGLRLDGKDLKPAKVTWQNERQLKFILKEGKKRQIRRMCELVGLKVVGLKRVRIGQVMLSDLPEGQWRILGDNESF